MTCWYIRYNTWIFICDVILTSMSDNFSDTTSELTFSWSYILCFQTGESTIVDKNGDKRQIATSFTRGNFMSSQSSPRYGLLLTRVRSCTILYYLQPKQRTAATNTDNSVGIFDSWSSSRHFATVHTNERLWSLSRSKIFSKPLFRMGSLRDLSNTIAVWPAQIFLMSHFKKFAWDVNAKLSMQRQNFRVAITVALWVTKYLGPRDHISATVKSSAPRPGRRFLRSAV